MCEEEEGGGGTLAGLVNYGERTTHLGDHEVERGLLEDEEGGPRWHRVRSERGGGR